MTTKDSQTMDTHSQNVQNSTLATNQTQVFPAGLVPQLLLAASSGQPPGTPTTPSMLPMQQLLIPVSAGVGGQQFITIPLPMAGAAGQPIQLLTTSNGQMFATNLTLPNLQTFPTLPISLPSATTATTNPTNIGLSSQNGPILPHSMVGTPVQAKEGSQPQLVTAVQSPYLLGSQVVPVNASVPPTQSYTSAPALSQQLAMVASVNTSSFTPNTSTYTPYTMSVGKVPDRSFTSQVSSSQGESHRPSNSLEHPINYSVQQRRQQPVIVPSAAFPKQITLPSSVPHPVHLQQAATAATSVQQSLMPQSAVSTNTLNGSTNTLTGSTNTLVSQNNVASQHLFQGKDRLTSPSSVNGFPNVSDLLPIGNTSENTTVDGINLDEIKEFAKTFKLRRLSLGLTQTQVGQALSATEGPAYSQSAICRFEKLDITPKSAHKIKPVLERWMQEAEERHKNGFQNLSDFIGCESSKKRKRRTSFTPAALEVLNEFFERNTHPSGADMTALSNKLNYEREVIRVWFCNKRQALKNTIKKLRQDRFDRAQRQNALNTLSEEVQGNSGITVPDQNPNVPNHSH